MSSGVSAEPAVWEDTEKRARSVTLRGVHKVVVHLHHDSGARVRENTGAGGNVIRCVAWHPGTDPLRRAKAVARCGIGSRVGLGQTRPAEARPALATGLVVQLPRLESVLAGGFEQDHVVDDPCLLRLDDRTRDEHVLRQVGLEQEAVIFVHPTDGRLRHIGLRGRKRQRCSGRSVAFADRCDRATRADTRASPHPAADLVLLGGAQDSPRLA